MNKLSLVFYLLAAHALTDYAWQSEFIATYKDPLKTTGRDKVGPWWWSMAAHGLINGLGVSLVTGSLWLGIAETILHSVTDTLKCVHRINTWTDQSVHLASKVVWAFLA